MTLRPDPFTEIREALESMSAEDFDAANGYAALAALAGLEREAAERETALAEWKEPWRIIAVNDVPFDGDLHLTPATVVARLKELQARVREVEAANKSLRTAWRENVEEIRLQYQAVVREAEAERDEALEKAEIAATWKRAWPSEMRAYHDRMERAEATVARQAETLQEIAGMCDVGTPNGNTYIEARRLARARLASPEAAAAEPTEWERPLEVGGILWLAAIDRVPIEERIEWVARMTLRVAEINAHRAALAAAALPAVDAPPEPTT